MLSNFKRFNFAFIFVALLAWSNEIQAQEATPIGISELDQYFLDNLPEWLVLGESEFKDFEGENGGRYSVAGELILTTDLLASDRDHRGIRTEMLSLYEQAVAEAAAHMVVRDGRLREVRVQEFVVEVPAGLRIPFSAELPYMETVSGVAIVGQILYQLPRSGERLITDRDLPTSSYIVDGIGFDTIVREAEILAAEIDNFINNVALRILLDAFLRYGEKPIVLTEYDNPIIQFDFIGNPLSGLSEKIRYRPNGPSGRDRIEFEFDIDISAYPGAPESYSLRANDPSKNWKLIFIIDALDRVPENIAVHIRSENEGTQQSWQFSPPILWTGEAFSSTRWKIYPFDPI